MGRAGCGQAYEREGHQVEPGSLRHGAPPGDVADLRRLPARRDVAGQARIAKKAEMNAERVLALLATRLNVPMPNLKDLFDGNNLKPMADLTVHRPLETYELR